VEHLEVPVKVTAWVDEGVVQLVEALNEFPDVVTLDSCQGYDGNGAYVLFRCQYQGSAKLARELGEALNGTGASYVLRAEWRPGCEEPLLELVCPSGEVAALAEAVSAFRTRVFPCGTADTEPRSSTGRLTRRPTRP